MTDTFAVDLVYTQDDIKHTAKLNDVEVTKIHTLVDEVYGRHIVTVDGDATQIDNLVFDMEGFDVWG